MHLCQLNLQGFRNISELSLSFSEGINLIYGENGSGKTSVLEAIYLLSTGQSFRSRISKNYIQFGQNHTTLFTRLLTDDGVDVSLGVQKSSAGKTVAKVDGSMVTSAQALSSNLPCHVFHSGSFDLLIGGPQQRRSFIDWLVFHVKHEFKQAWSQYARCLKQRNSLLRHDKIGPHQLKPWDDQLAVHGTAISDLRRFLIERYFEELLRFAEESGFEQEGLSIKYHQGWDEELSLAESLALKCERDIQQGFTSVGPHKADIRIRYQGRPIEDVLSRGQLKTFILAMDVAKIACYRRLKGYCPILLLDDIPAELDEVHQKRVLDWLTGFDTQMFVTSIKRDTFTRLLGSTDHYGDTKSQKEKTHMKMFHVKHGHVTEYNNETVGEDINV